MIVVADATPLRYLTDLPSAIAHLRQTNFRADEKLIEAILDQYARRRT
jgi:hypothetical protein